MDPLRIVDPRMEGILHKKAYRRTVFLASNLVQVGIHTCVDFTLYEEVFYTQGGTPPYDFLFTQSWVTISGTPSLWSSWCTFCTLSPPVPPGVFVTWNTYDVFIDNPDR